MVASRLKNLMERHRRTGQTYFKVFNGKADYREEEGWPWQAQEEEKQLWLGHWGAQGQESLAARQLQALRPWGQERLRFRNAMK